MRKRLMALALAAMMPLLSGCDLVSSTYSIAIGEQESDFYDCGELAAVNMSKEIPGLRLEPLATGGSIDDAKLLAEGEAQFGILTADVCQRAYNGQGEFAGSANKSLRLVAQLFPAALHLVASDTSGIKTMEDMRGKRISLGMEASGVYALATTAIEAAGISLKDLQRQNLTFEQSIENMKAGLIDAFFVLAAPGSAAIGELYEDVSVTIVPLEQSAVDALTEDGQYSAYEIAAGTYENMEEPVSTAAVDVLLVCSQSVSDRSVKAVAEYVEENREALFVTAAAGNNLWVVAQSEYLPLHEGLISEELA